MGKYGFIGNQLNIEDFTEYKFENGYKLVGVMGVKSTDAPTTPNIYHG